VAVYVSIVIYDIAGRQVYNENTAIKQGLNQIIINKNSITSGIYFYNIMQNTESLTQGKLMVK
jgi:hypothetical protein